MEPNYVALSLNGHLVKVIRGGAGEARLLACGYVSASEDAPTNENPEKDSNADPSSKPVLMATETDDFSNFLENKTKTALADYALQEFGLQLDTRRNKTELIQQIHQAVRNALQNMASSQDG